MEAPAQKAPGFIAGVSNFPAYIQIPLFIVICTMVSWSIDAEEHLLLDTGKGFSEPWRLLTCGLIHADFSHLAGNMVFLLIPLAVSDGIHYLEHGQPFYARKVTWAMFFSLLTFASAASSIYVQFSPSNAAVKSLGCSHAVVGMYSYSVCIIPQEIIAIWRRRNRAVGILAKLKLFLTLVGCIIALLFLSLAAFLLVFSDLHAYEKIRQHQNKSMLGKAFAWVTGSTPEETNVDYSAHILGLVMGFFIGVFSVSKR